MIEESDDPEEIIEALNSFTGKIRKDSPEFIFRVFDLHDDVLDYFALSTISKFRHPKARAFISAYKTDDSDEQELLDEIRNVEYFKGGRYID